MVYGRSRPSPQEFVFLRTSHPFLDGCPLLLLGLEISVHVYIWQEHWLPYLGVDMPIYKK